MLSNSKAASSSDAQLDLQLNNIDLNACQYIPENMARTHNILAMFRLERLLYTAISSLDALVYLEQVEREQQLSIFPIMCNADQLEALIEECYSSKHYIIENIKHFEQKKNDWALSAL